MPKNNVSDLITDQEIAFAHLVLSGTMTDRRAAEAVGLHPDSAAYTKSKPRVHAYMLEHRAAVQQQLVEQDTGLSRLPRPAVGSAVEEQRRFNLSRDQILDRLWEIANLGPEMTRGSITGQVKALSMIIAIEGLIPDRRAASAQNQSAPPPVPAQIYEAAWLRTQQPGENVDPQPTPPPTNCHPDRSEAQRRDPRFSQTSAPRITPEPTPDVSEPTVFAAPLNPSPKAPPTPRVPMADYFAPDTRVPFSIKKRFAPRR
jgi:hypothetical protein